MFEQGPLPRRTDPRDARQFGLQGPAAAQFAMVGDRKTMSLVAQPFQEKKSGRSAPENDGIFAAGQEKTLLGPLNDTAAGIGFDPAFGNARQVDASTQRHLFKQGEQNAQLALPAVDQDKVRQIVLSAAARPCAEGPLAGPRNHLLRQPI